MIDEVGELMRQVARDRRAAACSGSWPRRDVTRRRPARWSPSPTGGRAAHRPRACALLPGSAVVGEEAVAADPAMLDRLRDGGAVWLVDPVDGTANFAAGRGPFAVMVALLRERRTAAGWILDPRSRTA